MKIFISHSAKDNNEARKIAAKLKNANLCLNENANIAYYNKVLTGIFKTKILRGQ